MKYKPNFNINQASKAAYKKSKRSNANLEKSYDGAVKDAPKRLAKSSTWEDVKRRREEGDSLMIGGNGREFSRATHFIRRNGEIVEENIPL